MASAVTLTTGDPPYPGSSSSVAGMLADPASKAALSLGVVSIAQDAFMGKSVSIKKAAMLSVADYVALKYLAGYFSPMLSSLTGESQISGKFAEALALTGTLMASNYSGLFPRVEADGVIQSPNVGSGPIANFFESAVDASVLLLEREGANWALGKSGLSS